MAAATADELEFSFKQRLVRGYALLWDMHKERTAAYLPLLPIFKVCTGEFGLHVPRMALRDPELGKDEVEMVDAYLPKGFERFVQPLWKDAPPAASPIPHSHKRHHRPVLQRRDLKLKCMMSSKRAAEDLGMVFPPTPPSSEPPRIAAPLVPHPPTPSTQSAGSASAPVAPRPPAAAGAATFPLRDPDALLDLYHDGDSTPSERIAGFYSFALGTQSPIRMYLEELTKRRLAQGKESIKRPKRPASPLLMARGTNAEEICDAGSDAAASEPDDENPMRPYAELDGFLPLELFDAEDPKVGVRGWMMKMLDDGGAEWMACHVAARDPITLFYEVVVASNAPVQRTTADEAEGYPSSPSARRASRASAASRTSASSDPKAGSHVSLAPSRRSRGASSVEEFGMASRRQTLAETDKALSQLSLAQDQVPVRPHMPSVTFYTRLISRYYLRFDDEPVAAFYGRIRGLKARRREAERVFRTEFVVANMQDDKERGLPDEIINSVLHKAVHRLPKSWEGRVMQYLHQVSAEHHYAMRRARLEYYLLSPVFRAQIKPLGVVDRLPPPPPHTPAVPRNEPRRSRYKMSRDIIGKSLRLSPVAQGLLLYISDTWAKVSPLSFVTFANEYLPAPAETPVGAVLKGAEAAGEKEAAMMVIRVGPLTALDFTGFARNQRRHAMKLMTNHIRSWKKELDMHVAGRLQKKFSITAPLPAGHPLHRFIRLVNLRTAACLRSFACASLEEYIAFLESFLPLRALHHAVECGLAEPSTPASDGDMGVSENLTPLPALLDAAPRPPQRQVSFIDTPDAPSVGPRRAAGTAAHAPGMPPKPPPRCTPPSGTAGDPDTPGNGPRQRVSNASAGSGARSGRTSPALSQVALVDESPPADTAWNAHDYGLCGLPPMLPKAGYPLLTLRIDAILVNAEGFCAEEIKRVDFQSPLSDVREELKNVAQMMAELVSDLPFLEEPVPTAVKRKATPMLKVFLNGMNDPVVLDACERIDLVFDVFEPRLMEILSHYRRLESAFQAGFVDKPLFGDMSETAPVVGKLTELAAARNAVTKVTPDHVFIGPFLVDCALVKRQLIASHSVHMDRYMVHIQDYLDATSRKACALYEQLWKELSRRPGTPEQYEAFQEATEKLLAELRAIEDEDVPKMKRWMAVSEQFRWPLDDAVFSAVYTMRRWPLRIKSALEASDKQLVGEMAEFVAALKRDRDVLQFDLAQARQMIEKLFTLHDYDQAEIAAGRARQIAQLLGDCLTRSRRVAKHEHIFNIPRSDWSEIEMLVERTAPIIDVWRMAHDWVQTHPRLSDSTFDVLDLQGMQSKVVAWRQAFRITVRALRGYPLPQQLARRLELEVAVFQHQLVWVGKLMGNGVRVRHWKMLRVELGIAPDVDLTIAVLLKAGVEDNLLFVEKLAEQASKESEIETSLEQMRVEWKDRRINLTEWGGRCMLALSELFEHLALIDKHLMNTQLLRGMQGISFFEKVARDWEDQLTRVQTALTLWHSVQELWMSLRPIFENDRVCGEVQNEARRFVLTDKLWVKLMREGAAAIRVIALPEDFGPRLKEVSSNLTFIKQGLVEFLNTRRLKWPRLFWLTDNVILEMISSTGGSGGSVRLEKHLATCFEGIARLTSDEDGNIINMSSRCGETVKFNTPIRRLHESIDTWLSQVEKGMRDTLPTLLKDCMENMFQVAASEWLERWPAQVVLLALRIFEKQDADELLGFSGLKGLAALRKKHTRHIEEITARVLVAPPPNTRERLFYEALMAHHLASRDRAQRLIDLEVTKATDFNFSVMLHHQLHPSSSRKVLVSVAHVTLPYQFEYLGECSSLIATPVTDRAQRMLLVTLAGGSAAVINGPAGIGKGHVTKDLALQVGVKSLQVDVSPSLLWGTLLNALCGAISVGAWCVLASIEQVSDAVMAKLSPALAQIYQWQDQCDTHIELSELCTEREEPLRLKLAPRVLISATRNHVHHEPLPDSIKELFRPISIHTPDVEVVCQHLLTLSGCVQYATVFAARLVLVLRTAEGLLPLPSPMTFLKKLHRTMLLVNLGACGEDAATERTDPMGASSGATTVEWAEYHLLANVFFLCTAPVLTKEEFALVRALFERHFSEFGPMVHPGKVHMPLADGPHTAPLGSEIEVAGGPPVTVTEGFRKSLLLLTQQLALNRSVILCGPAGCGKSTLVAALAGAGRRPIIPLVPASMSIAVLCGRLGAGGRWEVGVLPKLLRRVQDTHVWLVFDGGVGETFNRFLTLIDDAVAEYRCISGEHLALSAKSQVLIETLSLADASPALVTRAGLCLMPDDADWRLVFRRVVAEHLATKKVNCALFESFRTQIYAMLETVIPPVREFADEYVPEPEPFIISIQRIAVLFLAIFAQVNNFTEGGDALRCYVEVPVVHAVFTVLVSPLPDAALPKFHDVFPLWMNRWGGGLRDLLPLHTSPLDCFPCDGKWIRITDHPLENALQPPLHIPSHSRAHYQPLPNSIRVVYLAELLAPFHVPVAILGGPLSGKTSLLQLIRARREAQYLSTALSSRTKATSLQGFVEARLTKRRHGVVGPPFGQTCLLVLEDLHLPDAAPSSPDSVLELMVSLLKYGKWHDANSSAVDVVDVDVIGTHVTDYAMSPRLLPLMFPVYLYRELTASMCTGVVAAILHAWAGKFGAGLANALADIIVGTWDYLSKAFPAAPDNLRLWSVEDVFAVARAIALHPRDLYKQRHVALSLTVSTLFTVCGRFFEKAPLDAMDKKVVELMEKHMKVQFSETALAPSQLVYSTLQNVDECLSSQTDTASVISQVQGYANQFLKEHLKNFKGLYGIQEVDDEISHAATPQLPVLSPTTTTVLHVTAPADLNPLPLLSPLASPVSSPNSPQGLGSPLEPGAPPPESTPQVPAVTPPPAAMLKLAASVKAKAHNPFFADPEKAAVQRSTAKRQKLLSTLKSASKVVVHQQQQPLVINKTWATIVSHLVMALRHPKRHAVVVSDQGDAVRSLALLATYVVGMKVVVDMDQGLPAWGDRLDSILRQAALAPPGVEYVWVLHDYMMDDAAAADLSLLMSTDTCMLIRPDTLKFLQEQLLDEATSDLALYVQRKATTRLHCVLICNAAVKHPLCKWKRYFPALFYSPFVVVASSALDTGAAQVKLAATTFCDTLRLEEPLASQAAEACYAVYSQYAALDSARARPCTYRQLITTFCRIYSTRCAVLTKQKAMFCGINELIACCKAQGTRDESHTDALGTVLAELDGQRRALVEMAETWKAEVAEKQRSFKELEDSCVEKVQSHAATRAECDRMMKEAIPAMDKARDALGVLTDKQISAVRFLAVPAPNVKRVMEAICLALGRKTEKQTRAAGSTDLQWKLSQSVLADPDFVQQVQQVQVERLPPSILEHLSKCLEDKGFNPEKLRATGLLAIELLCEYLLKLHDFLQMKSVVLPKQAVLLEDDEHIKDLVKQMEQRRQDTVAARKQVNVYQRQIDTLESRFASVATFRDAAAVRRKNGDLLSDAVGPVEAKWLHMAKKVTLDLEILPNTCVVTAAMLVFFPFPPAAKDMFIKAVYNCFPEPPPSLVAEVHGITLQEAFRREPQCDLVAALGGAEDVALSVVEEVLPATPRHAEQACACAHTLKCPVFIDSYGAALKFLQTQHIGHKLVVAGQDRWGDVVAKAMGLGIPTIVLIEDVTPEITAFARIKVNGYGLYRGNNITVKKGFHLFFVRRESGEGGQAWMDRQGDFIREFVTLFDFQLDDAHIKELACLYMAFAIDEQTQTLYATRLRQLSSAYRYGQNTYQQVERALFAEAVPEVLWRPDTTPDDKIVLPTSDLTMPFVPLKVLPSFLSKTEAVMKVVDGLRTGAEADERTAKYRDRLEEARDVIMKRFGPLARDLIAVHNAVAQLTHVHAAYGSSFLFLLTAIVTELKAGTELSTSVAQYTSPMQAWDADPEHIRTLVFQSLCRLLAAGMFPEHRPLFAFLVTLELNRHRALPGAHAITAEEWAAFQMPPTVRHGVDWGDPQRPWMRDVLDGVRKLNTALPCFADLPAAVEYDVESWLAVFRGGDPPATWRQRLTAFQLLILRRAVNPDGLAHALLRYAAASNVPLLERMGPVAVLRDGVASRAATPDVPLLFLSQRAEPTAARHELERLAWSLGGSTLVTIPFIPGPAAELFRTLDFHLAAVSDDPAEPECTWILVERVADYPKDTVLALKHKIESLGRAVLAAAAGPSDGPPGQATGTPAPAPRAPAKKFRFFAATDVASCHRLPQSFVYRAIKLVAPAAVGMSQQLGKGLEVGPLRRRWFAQPDDPGRAGFHQVLWLATMLHAGLAERQRFGAPYGWLQPHRWDDTDLKELIVQVATGYRGMVQGGVGAGDRERSKAGHDTAAGLAQHTPMNTQLLEFTRFLIGEVVYDLHSAPRQAAHAQTIFSTLVDVCTGTEPDVAQVGAAWLAPTADHQEHVLCAQRLPEHPPPQVRQVPHSLMAAVAEEASREAMGWAAACGEALYRTYSPAEAPAPPCLRPMVSEVPLSVATSPALDGKPAPEEEAVVARLLDAAAADPPRGCGTGARHLPATDEGVQSIIRANEVALHLKQVALLRRRISLHDAADAGRFVDVPAGVAPAFPAHFVDACHAGQPLLRLLKMMVEKWGYLRRWDEDHPKDLWLLACAHPRAVLAAFAGTSASVLRGVPLRPGAPPPAESTFRLVRLTLGGARLTGAGEVASAEDAAAAVGGGDALSVAVLPELTHAAAEAQAVVPLLLACAAPQIRTQHSMDHVCCVEVAALPPRPNQPPPRNPFLLCTFDGA